MSKGRVIAHLVAVHLTDTPPTVQWQDAPEFSPPGEAPPTSCLENAARVRYDPHHRPTFYFVETGVSAHAASCCEVSDKVVLVPRAAIVLKDEILRANV